jgi:hypothetical protein
MAGSARGDVGASLRRLYGRADRMSTFFESLSKVGVILVKGSRLFGGPIIAL